MTMSRIQSTFAALAAQGKKGLIPFITAGDPAPELTVELMHALVDGGADVIELGVPFSDPMADGPVIQRSSERALKHGVGLRQVLGFVSEFRQTDSATPVVLMGYANPIECMGQQAFVDAAHATDINKTVVVDVIDRHRDFVCVRSEHQAWRAARIEPRDGIAIGVSFGFVGKVLDVIEPHALAAGFIASRARGVNQSLEKFQ